MKIIDKNIHASFREMASWTWKATLGVRKRIVAVTAVGLLRVTASLTFVWLSKMLIDAATAPSTSLSHIWLLAGLLILCMLAELTFSQTSEYIKSLTSQRMVNNMRRHIYRVLLHSDLYAERRHSGDILNRITLDVGTVVNTATGTLPSIVIMMVQLGAAFWLLCEMNPMLALCALLISPVAIISTKAYIHRMRHINSDIRKEESDIHTSLQEGLQHRVVVQTLECAPEMSRRLDDLQGSLFDKIVFRTRIHTFTRSTVRLGFIVGYLVAFIWSVFELHSGAITFGIMTAFLQLVGRIQGPISSLSSTLPSLVNNATAIDRLMELDPLDDKNMENTVVVDLGKTVGVALNSVTFSYGDGEPDVLNHFSHDFYPSSKTVIMGETGIGKSTLVKLILALLHPDGGAVEIYSSDGGRVEACQATRRYMAYVPQGNSLMEGSIRDNLSLGDPSASDEDLARALHTAAADFVFTLPQGLDTPCGELGSGLSEGQCQRIAIARALLRDCPVLILDEFNSSLDTATAATLMERLVASRPDATMIFISHRPEVAATDGVELLKL